MSVFKDIPNLHTHTKLCKHAAGVPEEYCAEAEKVSNILGFSDHCPFPDGRYGKERMEFSELKHYCQLIEQASEKYPGMQLLAGAEVEWCNDMGRNFYNEVLLGEFNLDYLVGSAHYSGFDLGNQEHFFYQQPSPDVTRDFVDVTLKLIESGIFTYIAHPDAFMVPYTEVTKEHESMFREIISAAVQYDVPLEINAGGVRTKRSYPNRVFWEIASEYPTLKTVVNADAHTPEQLYNEDHSKALNIALDLKLNICNLSVAQNIIKGKKK
ncbi:MAG: PHP domain-containing protein [Lentisphaeria bacterium]|nr:PHP domain-containing protein [Lentisphaeria bacterium]